MPDPALADLERAVKRLGLTGRKEEKSHPLYWMKREGRIVVAWEGSKEELLKQVAKKMEKRK